MEVAGLYWVAIMGRGTKKVENRWFLHCKIIGFVSQINNSALHICEINSFQGLLHAVLQQMLCETDS